MHSRRWHLQDCRRGYMIRGTISSPLRDIRERCTRTRQRTRLHRYDPSVVAALITAMSVMLLAACGASSTPGATSTGTLVGRVTAGPTCPVERVGHPCPPAPVSATVRATTAQGRVVGSVHTDRMGGYRLELRPGAYTLIVVMKGSLPRCSPVAASVRANQTSRTAISCDTGIR